MRGVPNGRGELPEALFYEMDCFGTRMLFEYPTVFIDQLDDETLLGLKENPVALATLCAKRMYKARKSESKRYEYAEELLKLMRSAGYTKDTYIRLSQFIEGLSNLSASKWVKKLEAEIGNVLEEEVNPVDVVRTPILRKVLRRKLKECFRAEGRAEGKAEGRAEGKAEGEMEIARRMFDRGMELAVIAELTGVSTEELNAALRG